MKNHLKSIAPIELSRFRPPNIEGNRSFPWRAAWYMVNAILFQSSIFGLLPGRAKAIILRAFGAKVGHSFVCKPRVTIKYPWFLEVGNHVWIGEQAWIDNLCTVRIGNSCCISQGVYLCTGNHDWSDPTFAFFCQPITFGDGVWVTAFSMVPPGTTIPDNSLWSSSNHA